MESVFSLRSLRPRHQESRGPNRGLQEAWFGAVAWERCGTVGFRASVRHAAAHWKRLSLRVGGTAAGNDRVTAFR